MKPALFTGYETRQFENGQFMFAKKFKALFDFIYLTPLNSPNDLMELLLNSRINWGALEPGEKEEFADFCLTSKSQKMRRTVEILRKEALI
jgi:hypothetical protein